MAWVSGIRERARARVSGTPYQQGNVVYLPAGGVTGRNRRRRMPWEDEMIGQPQAQAGPEPPQSRVEPVDDWDTQFDRQRQVLDYGHGLELDKMRQEAALQGDNIAAKGRAEQELEMTRAAAERMPMSPHAGLGRLENVEPKRRVLQAQMEASPVWKRFANEVLSERVESGDPLEYDWDDQRGLRVWGKEANPDYDREGAIMEEGFLRGRGGTLGGGGNLSALERERLIGDRQREIEQMKAGSREGLAWAKHDAEKQKRAEEIVSKYIEDEMSLLPADATREERQKHLDEVVMPAAEKYLQAVRKTAGTADQDPQEEYSRMPEAGVSQPQDPIGAQGAAMEDLPYHADSAEEIATPSGERWLLFEPTDPAMAGAGWRYVWDGRQWWLREPGAGGQAARLPRQMSPGEPSAGGPRRAVAGSAGGGASGGWGDSTRGAGQGGERGFAAAGAFGAGGQARQDLGAAAHELMRRAVADGRRLSYDEALRLAQQYAK